MSRFVVDPFLVVDDVDSNYFVVAHAVSPYVSAYVWDDGFGSKFSNPATLPTGTANSVVFSTSNSSVIVAHSNSPYVSAYAWSGAGFGSKFSDPATPLSAAPTDVSFNYLSDVVGLSTFNVSPRVMAYAWSDSSGWGSKFADPATVPPRDSSFVSFNSNENRLGDTLAVAGTGSLFTPPGDQPYAFLYEWNAGFGTKYTDFATTVLGAQVCTGISFNSIDNAFAFGNFWGQQPYLVHSWTNGTGFGSKFADPAGYTTQGTLYDVAFSYDNKAFMVGVLISSGANVPFKAYAWSDSGFGSKYADPSVTESSGSTSKVTFSRRDAYVAATRGSTNPYIIVYSWDSVSGFGSRIAAPGSLYAGVGFNVNNFSFSN